MCDCLRDEYLPTQMGVSLLSARLCSVLHDVSPGQALSDRQLLAIEKGMELLDEMIFGGLFLVGQLQRDFRDEMLIVYGMARSTVDRIGGTQNVPASTEYVIEQLTTLRDILRSGPTEERFSSVVDFFRILRKIVGQEMAFPTA